MFHLETPPRDRPPHPRAAEMAGAMAQIAAEKGMPCMLQDLLDEGFTPDEIGRHGDLARALAARLHRDEAPPFAALKIDGWRHKATRRRQTRLTPSFAKGG